MPQKSIKPRPLPWVPPGRLHSQSQQTPMAQRNQTDSTKGLLMDPQLPARELPCPGQTPHGISADVLRRAYEAGTHARRKLEDPSLAAPKTPELEKKLRNSWIVVLRGQESEGHSLGVYHTKWTRDKCAHCRLLRAWIGHHTFLAQGHMHLSRNLYFMGSRPKKKFRLTWLAPGFWILTFHGCAKAKEEYDAGDAW